MPSSASPPQYRFSLSNWVIGGPLLTSTNTSITNGVRRTSQKRVMIVQDNGDMNYGSNRSSSNGTLAASENGQDKKTEDGKTKFTAAQDKKIKSMKNAGNTWKEIATAVDSTKNEVRDRFKELTDPDNENGEKKEGASDGGNNNKTNGKKKDESTVKNEKSGWTWEQDEKIKAMKAENKSWKEIAHEVGASKSDAQSRFKELNQTNNFSAQASGSGGGSGFGADIAADLNDVAAEVTNDLGIDFSGLFTDDNWGNYGGSGWGKPMVDIEEEKAKEKAAVDAAANKGDKKKKSKKQGAGNTSSNSQQTASHNNDYSSIHVNTDNNNYQGEGNGCRLKPDYLWTAMDVDILDELESQYTAHKWLHLQADFYNRTGRMVHATLIEQKFRDDGLI